MKKLLWVVVGAALLSGPGCCRWADRWCGQRCYGPSQVQSAPACVPCAPVQCCPQPAAAAPQCVPVGSSPAAAQGWQRCP